MVEHLQLTECIAIVYLAKDAQKARVTIASLSNCIVGVSLLLRLAMTAHASAYEEEKLLTSCAGASPELCVQVHLGNDRSPHFSIYARRFEVV